MPEPFAPSCKFELETVVAILLSLIWMFPSTFRLLIATRPVPLGSMLMSAFDPLLVISLVWCRISSHSVYEVFVYESPDVSRCLIRERAE